MKRIGVSQPSPAQARRGAGPAWGSHATAKKCSGINGVGDYGFLLTCIDGQQPGGGGTDKFRIKIWDKATSQIVYDNQVASSERRANGTRKLTTA